MKQMVSRCLFDLGLLTVIRDLKIIKCQIVEQKNVFPRRESYVSSDESSPNAFDSDFKPKRWLIFLNSIN